MGKNYTIYLHDDVEVLINDVENRGSLINNLIRDHFASNDEEYIRRQIENKRQEEDFLQKRLDKLITKRTAENNKVKESIDSEALKAKKDIVREKIMTLWREDKIKDDDYYSCFNKEGKLDLDIALKYVQEI